MAIRRLPVLILVLIASACGGTDGSSDESPEPVPSTTTTTTPPAPSSPTTARPTSTTSPMADSIAEWDGNPATLVSPVEVLDSFEFEFVFIDDVREEPWGIIMQGVFNTPDSFSCAVTNPEFVDASGNIAPLGRITATGDFAWWDDGVLPPERSDRNDEFFDGAFELCPGASEFWHSFEFLQFIGFELDPLQPQTCTRAPSIPGGGCPLEFVVVGPGERIEGFSTTLIDIRSTDERLEVGDGSLWVADAGWPIRFLFNATGPGRLGVRFDEPFTLGDDPNLDQLWFDCEAGVLATCELLLDESPLLSAYEIFGWTCGLRFLPSQGTSCQDESPTPQEEPYTLGDDPTLDALWRSCENGNDDDCDRLFDVSPIGSAYELFGETCGLELDTDLAPCADVRSGLPMQTTVNIEIQLSRINDQDLTVHIPSSTFEEIQPYLD